MSTNITQVHLGGEDGDFTSMDVEFERGKPANSAAVCADIIMMNGCVRHIRVVLDAKGEVHILEDTVGEPEPLAPPTSVHRLLSSD